MSFAPKYTITAKTAAALMRIEAARQAVVHLPITPGVLATLRETARLYSTHCSTQIEGNQLSPAEVSQVLAQSQHFAWRERDEKEVLGSYAAIEKVERLAAAAAPVTEAQIQNLHALVMAGGTAKVRPTPYRDGQNVIRDGRSGGIVYLPPEAVDVPGLMRELVSWLRQSEPEGLPCPLRAGIAHYQFATIHPYYDRHGRTGRLLTTLILQLGGYGLKGRYALEEYYARNLGAYYAALTIGPSHNYYLGLAEAEITPWVEYFCLGVAESFENVRRRAEQAAATGARDLAPLLRQLDPRQRRALELFRPAETITSQDLEKLFSIAQRTGRNWLTEWSGTGFRVVVGASKKGRRYRLAGGFRELLGT